MSQPRPSGSDPTKLPLAGGTMTGALTLGATTGAVFPGATSGNATLKAQPLTGTPLVSLPATSGTLAILGANTFTAAQTFNSGTGAIFPGGTSGAVTLLAPAVAGATVITLPGVSSTLVSSLREESIVLAASDETTALSVGNAKITFRAPYAMILTGVKASVNTAPTGSTLIVDINESGVTLLSTKLSIDATEKTSATAASVAVISDSSIAADAEISIDIDQVGSTIAGAGLKVTLLYTRP